MSSISFIEPRSNEMILVYFSRLIRNREPQESIPDYLLRRFDDLARKALPHGVTYNDAAHRLRSAKGLEYEQTYTELYIFCEKITEAHIH